MDPAALACRERQRNDHVHERIRFRRRERQRDEHIAVPIDAGSRILGLRARVKGTGGTGNVVVSLIRWRDDGPESTEGTLTIVDPPSSWATYSAPISMVNVAAGDAYWLRCAFALANQRVTGLAIDYDRPL